MRHQGFLQHRGYAYAWAAGGVSLGALALYRLLPGERSGGDALGYVLGVASAGLILWLAALGLRKRAITPGRWSLKGWTSAHVYLGLALAVLATLHAAFRFGWNVHTLAYALLLVMEASGAVGVLAYAILPARMSDNRGETSGAQMLRDIAALDIELALAAQPLPEAQAARVRRALEAPPIPRALLARLAIRPARCATSRAAAALRRHAQAEGVAGVEAAPALALLERRVALLTQVRRHVRYRALLEAWLFVHVPVTFALVAAVAVHVLSVFWFW